MDNKVKVSYCDYNSVLVVNPSGKLRQVFTPFRVWTIREPGQQRQVHIVDEVRSTKEDQLVYLINDIPYYHFLFTIDIQF